MQCTVAFKSYQQACSRAAMLAMQSCEAPAMNCHPKRNCLTSCESLRSPSVATAPILCFDPLGAAGDPSWVGCRCSSLDCTLAALADLPSSSSSITPPPEEVLPSSSAAEAAAASAAAAAAAMLLLEFLPTAAAASACCARSACSACCSRCACWGALGTRFVAAAGLRLLGPALA